MRRIAQRLRPVALSLLLAVSCGAIGLADDLALPDLQKQVQKVVERARPATVAVVNRGSSGSGIIVDAEGLILTAGHVVPKPGERVTIVFPDGKREKAKVLGSNRSRDSAMARLEGEGPWPFVEVAETGTVVAGEWVVATGHPGGFDRSRPPPVRLGRVLDSGRFILSDCTVVGGDSGGPLFDLEGRVIGIHSSIGASTEQNNHVPVDVFRRDWDRLVQGESWGQLRGRAPTGPRLGVRLETGEKGVRIREVTAGSPAAAGGLQVDDILLKIADEAVASNREVGAAVRSRQPGDKLALEIRRGEETLSLEIALGEWPGTKEAEAEAAEERARRARRAQQPRNRNELEKDHPTILAPWHLLIAAGQKATVRLQSEDEEQLALGTVVDRGLVLTKASQLSDSVVARFEDGSTRPALLLAEDVRHDLALLAVDTRDLEPVAWAEGDDPGPGAVVAALTPGRTKLLRPGVLSVEPRSLESSTRPALGIQAGETENGVRVVKVFEKTGAAKVGLREGDVITKLDGKKVTDVVELVEAIQAHEVGETLEIELLREGETRKFSAPLGRRNNVAGEPPLNQQDRMSGPVSKRRSEFPSIFQHDAEIRPQDCGGPVIDVNGRLLGLNIARAGRINTYAIPVSVLRESVMRLAQASRAARKGLVAAWARSRAELEAARARFEAAESELEEARQRLEAAASALGRSVESREI